jgi:hypothetical protein
MASELLRSDIKQEQTEKKNSRTDRRMNIVKWFNRKIRSKHSKFR